MLQEDHMVRFVGDWTFRPLVLDQARPVRQTGRSTILGHHETRVTSR